MNEILTHRSAGVLTVSFNRAQRKNAITSSMYQTLTQTLQAAAQDSEVRVVLLQGDATVFTAGNDLGDFIDNPPLDAQAPVWRFLHALNDFPKPLIAAVCGVAVGIGTTLLLHCDLVYAASDARFSLPFVNLGVSPEGASSLLLPRLMGYPRAAEALLTGEPFDAEFALRAGLVNQLLPADQVQDWALTQAQKIAQKPAAAVAEAKRLLKRGVQGAVHACIDEEAQVFARLLQEDTAQTAIAGFSRRLR
ncbi:enoyl-CoA hydratase [Pseudomonas sp. Teo4]|uniref:enoyl-CoA hydratase n=1 Tax=Pseudomonas sp. Teo4 TaxID=3064528 RepID=UPI002AB93E0B|nr:enoyl-CoA hydratase [Pseudomonas sp. Teo4]MDZ3991704.1 2,3-dehydroadipyl-CoA hydratase [Pseudomonas sp. Teo4]